MMALTLLFCLGVSTVTSWDMKRILLLVSHWVKKVPPLERSPKVFYLFTGCSRSRAWKQHSEPALRSTWDRVAEGSLTITDSFSSTETQCVSPSCLYSPDSNLALCCAHEWMKPCCSLLWNNIKCHVSLNLQTWNSSLQLREWFLHVILNALCSRRVPIAVQPIVQWPSSVLSMFGVRWKHSECSLL